MFKQFNVYCMWPRPRQIVRSKKKKKKFNFETEWERKITNDKYEKKISLFLIAFI